MLSAGLAFSLFFAQTTGNVGINTANPQVTLDVSGNPTVTTSLDGLRAPQLTGVQLRAKTYTNAQTGTLVYVSAADTAPAGQTIDVTAAGYYYFNGATGINKWVPVTLSAIEPWRNAADNTPATSNTQNIYQNGKVAVAKSTIAATDPDFTVGGNGRATIGMENNAAIAAKNTAGAYQDFLIPRVADDRSYMDYGTGGMHIRNNAKTSTITLTDGNLVGIFNQNPQARLDVQSLGPGGAFRMADGTQGEGKVLNSDANGKAQWKTATLKAAPGPQKVFANSDTAAQPTQNLTTIDNNYAVRIKAVNFTDPTGWYSLVSRWYYIQNTESTRPAPQTGSTDLGAAHFRLVISDNASANLDAGNIVYEFRATVNADSVSPPSGSLIYLEQNKTYYVKDVSKHTRYDISGERQFFVRPLE